MGRRALFFHVCAVCLFLTGFSFADAQKVLYPEIAPVNARFDNFPIMNGRADQATTAVFQDSKGFMWFGTVNGLYRFDGMNYLAYGIDHEGEKGFAGYQVNNICEDPDGNIWIATCGALNKLEPKSGRFKHFFPDTTDLKGGNNIIKYIHCDQKGRLWLITDKNIFRFDRDEYKFSEFSTDSLSWVYPGKTYYLKDESDRFLEDTHGRIWIGTNNGLYHFLTDSQRLDRIYPGNRQWTDIGRSPVNCVKQDEEGNIWAGTQNDGLIRITGEETGDFHKISNDALGRSLPFDNNVTALLPDSSGILWVFGNHLFSGYNRNTGEVRNYLFSDRYSPYRKWVGDINVEKIFKDSDGSVLLVWERYGIVFRFEPESEKLSLYFTPAWVLTQCLQDNTGTLWFGCVRGNTFRLVRDSLSFLQAFVPNYSDVNSVHKLKMLEDNRKKLWLILSSGVYFVDDINFSNSFNLKKFDFPDKNFQAASVLQDSKGLLWFGGVNGDVIRYGPGTHAFNEYKLPLITNPESYLSAQVSIIKEDYNGDILFVTIGCGIYRMPKGSAAILPVRFNGLSKEDLDYLADFMILEDAFWIASASGLFRIGRDNRLIRKYSVPENMMVHNTDLPLRIIKDDKSNIWLLKTFSGIYQYDSMSDGFSKLGVDEDETGKVYYDMNIDSTGRFWIARNNEILVYDPASGFSRSEEFQRLQYDIQSFRLNSGLMLFLNESILYIFSERIPVNRREPPVLLTRLSVNGADFHHMFAEKGSFDKLGKIRLKNNQNNLRIEFAALNYLDPHKNRYRYILPGIDQDTVEAGHSMYAEYKALPPGKYRFWVTGSNNDNIWNRRGVSLDIHIMAPWYGSGVAFSIYAALILLLITGYIKARTYRLIKEKKRLEEVIEEHTRELAVKNKKLEEIDRIKTNFFTDISHEIRTPLSLIIDPLEKISRELVADEKLHQIIDLMRRNGQRLIRLVTQLLDISKLDAGKMKIMLSEQDIIKSIRILVYEFLSHAESRQIKYVVDIPDEKFITWFDRDKTEKIISNLLSNAFKFTPANGEVQCIIGIVHKNEQIPDKYLKVKIKDSGIGIQKEEISRIFERFYRVEERIETETRGTGIGLSLVNEFVRILHGEIEVNSTPGKGSEFTVTIPLGMEHLQPEEYIIADGKAITTTEEPPEADKYKYSKIRESKSTGHNLKILIIEDNVDLRNYIRENLSDNYNVITEENGRKGLNAAYTMIPDIIITDIMMPDIDGIQVCSQLKRDERTSHIPVIMLTAKTTADNKLEGLRSGADGYIFKPFSMDELKLQISNVLNLRENIIRKYSNLKSFVIGKADLKTVDDIFMDKLVRLINQHISDFDFDVNQIGEILGMSRMHLYRKIKILTGFSPGILIRNVRLEKSAELLQKNAGNITEIAVSVGFSNPSYFTKSFKYYFGVSPKDYVKQKINQASKS